MSRGDGQIKPRDVFESQFDKALEQVAEALKMTHELKGEVELAFIEIQALQFGNNSFANLKEIRKGILTGAYDDARLYDPRNPGDNSDKSKLLPAIDDSGWDTNYVKVLQKSQRIDEALSYVPDAIMDFVTILSRTDSLKQAKVNLPEPSTQQPLQLVKEKHGMLDYFRDFVDNLRSQNTKDFQRGIGIMSRIIEDFYDARIIWAEYTQYYMENRALAFLNDKRALYPLLLLQDELLMMDMGRILQVFNKGNRLDLIRLRGTLSDISAGILQSRQQQAMAMNPMMGAPFQPALPPQAAPRQLSQTNWSD